MEIVISSGRKTIEVLPAPNDVPHPRKWVPPAPGPGTAPWLQDDALSFTELLDKRVHDNPDKVALTWVEETGKVSQTLTYKQVSTSSS